MTKAKRSRNGCFTCKQRRRKCDELKPVCANCVSTGRECGGYGIRLSFDVDDSRHSRFLTSSNNGKLKYGFRGRPRLNDSVKEKPLAIPMVQDSSSSEKLLDPDTFEFLHKGLDYLFSGLSETEEEEEIMPLSIGEDIGMSEITNFIDNTNLYASSLSYSDENLVLRHFFNRLLPLLDSHPNNPWPELALKYCDFEIARSCFLSLSCMHLYGRKGGNQFYQTGMRHINSTMNYLIKYVRTNKKTTNVERKYNDEIKDDINVDSIVGDLKEEINQKRSSFFVILILIYVHILFSILESGKSVLSRVFLKLFATIVNDKIFQQVLDKIDQSQTFICILSWYDTITAIASPDCRLPYCDPRWYGTKQDEISLAKLSGCPGELFACIAKLCHLRNSPQDMAQYHEIKYEILNYREYVVLQLHSTTDETVQLKPEEEYEVRLKGAQCWAISCLVKLELIVKFDLGKIETLIDEFIMCYSSLDPQSTIVVQMVWPIFNIASECVTSRQRSRLKEFINILNQNGQTGTLKTLQKIVEQSWLSGLKTDEILSGKEWLESGTDFLVV